MAEVTTRRFEQLTVREFHDIVRLRCDVFVVEQACPYPEIDGRDTDPGTEHHWLANGDSIGCYARSLVESDGAVRIGRVVTAPAMRGRGLAKQLMGALIERFAGRRIVLDAQSHLAGWYGGLGFEVAGAEYVEDGIPHVPMSRPV